MRNTLKYLAAPALMVLACSAGIPTPAFATTGAAVSFESDRAVARVVPHCYADATTGQTYATTSYADVTGLSCTFTPTKSDPTAATNTVADLIEVSYSIDISKATSTTATCAVYANAAIVAGTARTTNTAAVEGVLSGTFDIPNTVAAAQTIKMQCKSGDTATATLNFGEMVVREVVRHGAAIH